MSVPMACHPQLVIRRSRNPGGPAETTGFSLAEVLVAGLVIVAVVIASARLLSTSLAGGQQIAQRQQVEAEIASDLERIRQEDQNLSASPSACNDPAAALKQSIDTALPDQGGASGRWSRQTTATANGLLQVTYSLQMAGSAGAETRVVELTPAIQGPCLEQFLGLS